MDKHTISNYGWIVAVILVLAIMISLATPFASVLSNGFKGAVNQFKDTGSGVLDNMGGANGFDDLGGGGTGGDSGMGEGGIGGGSNEESSGSGSTGNEGEGDDNEPPVDVLPEGGTAKVIAEFNEDFTEVVIKINNKYTDEEVENLSNVFDLSIPSNPAVMNNYSSSIDSPMVQHKSTLKSVVIGNGVQSIGNYMFSKCDQLESITVADSVTYIGAYAFSKCTKLSTATFSSSTLSVGDNAFEYCSSLTSLTIPDSAILGRDVFNSCTSLRHTVDNIIYVQTATNPYFYVQSVTNYDLTTYTINERAKYIGNGSFIGCDQMTSITIPNGVRVIEGSAFMNCYSLRSVTMPDSITDIGSSVFYCSLYVSEIHYGGTVDQWNAINKNSSWKDQSGSCTVYYQS